MKYRDTILSKFDPHERSGPVFLPDLDIWYQWQKEHDQLPPEWAGFSLDEVYRALSLPIWKLTRPWSNESPGVPVKTVNSGDERTTTIEAQGRVLTSRWTRGPDGDWWQTEYPAKTVEDLDAVLAYVQSRRYTIDLAVVEKACDEVGDDGIVAVELPSRPFSWLMLEMLGWGEGLMLLLDAEELVGKIITAAETQLQKVVDDLSECSATLFYSPDNIDGQFVSPGFFAQYLSESYASSLRILHAKGKKLMVHAGGPVGSILGAIAESGLDAVAGICGPPQGDTPLALAREKAGEGVTLIGGIAQDCLLGAIDDDEFLAALDQAQTAAAGDPRSIISIADHVPIDAEIRRLRTAAGKFTRQNDG